MITENKTNYTLGIDIGSTTVKMVLREGKKTLYNKYKRHYSKVREAALEMLEELHSFIGENKFYLALSGSAGLGLAESAGLPFVQEVFATGETVKRLAPDTSVVIELGGEDAKIIFFEGGTDERMNGTCAGGTGAFIDQMATLLDMSADEIENPTLYIKDNVTEIKALTPNGEKVDVPFTKNGDIYTLDLTVYCLKPAILYIK